MSDPLQLLPVIMVIVLWMCIGAFAFWFFARSLRVPTESEIELAAEHEHEHAATPATADEGLTASSVAH